MHFQPQEGKLCHVGWSKVKNLQDKGELTEENYARVASPEPIV